MQLTVVIFTYNYAHFLPEVLGSLQRQTRRADRVIVSDDCSPRDDLATLRAAIAPFEGVELIRNPTNLRNIEHYRARVAEIETDAYLLMSADDYLLDDTFLEAAMAELERDDSVIGVFGYHQPVDDQGRVLARRNVVPGRTATRLAAADVRRELAYENNVPAICTIVRTSVHRHVPAYPILNRHCGDWQQWYLLAELGDMVRLERVVLGYRIHGSNMSTTYDEQGRAHAMVLEGYDQLLAWPGLGEQDRRDLERGRRRLLIRSATMRDLPARLLHERWDGDTAAMAAESLLERVARGVERGRKALQARFLGANVTQM